MKIEILGAGCMKCKKLYENVKRAVEELGIDADVEKIEDMDKIISSGVMMTPAIAVDGKIKASGRIPSTEEIKKWIQE
ncbi:MAG: glutaredoxin [Candidatus Altiarchaeales archaeon WOR_SM1_86-2]|nr:MAG: glutaredoxin [Candidatus Altiarchaeales archaeon WOR_SM1_79]ODS35363.1 MAG: glutaredoxin [Candidatus Altiarchaeales archaeon WOR_SM1_86-2]